MSSYLTWIDHNQRTWKTPQILGRLKFGLRSHAALRAFIFIRGGFTCAGCGVKPKRPPAHYDGRNTVSLPGRHHLVADHIVARADGGLHHPSNMRALCDHCNAVKAGYEARAWNHRGRGKTRYYNVPKRRRFLPPVDPDGHIHRL